MDNLCDGRSFPNRHWLSGTSTHSGSAAPLVMASGGICVASIRSAETTRSVRSTNNLRIRHLGDAPTPEPSLPSRPRPEVGSRPRRRAPSLRQGAGALSRPALAGSRRGPADQRSARLRARSAMPRRRQRGAIRSGIAPVRPSGSSGVGPPAGRRSMAASTRRKFSGRYGTPPSRSPRRPTCTSGRAEKDAGGSSVRP